MKSLFSLFTLPANFASIASQNEARFLVLGQGYLRNALTPRNGIAAIGLPENVQLQRNVMMLLKFLKNSKAHHDCRGLGKAWMVSVAVVNNALVG